MRHHLVRWLVNPSLALLAGVMPACAGGPPLTELARSPIPEGTLTPHRALLTVPAGALVPSPAPKAPATPGVPAKTREASLEPERDPGQAWSPPRTAAEWMANPVRGAVVEIGYGGPEEVNDPPYPSVEDLRQLRGLGAQVIGLEVQYVWTIEPPYAPDEDQFARVASALDNVAAAGLYAVLSIRNGPGCNAMMPGIADEDVITALYTDATAQAAYQSMLRDLVSRFRDRPEIIAWEPIIEPAPDVFLTHEGPPYPQAAALWNDLAPQLVAAIREIDPERPILIEPVNYGGLDGFTLLNRFEDDNLIYSLHTYEPYAYTHQVEPPYAAYPGVFYDEYVDRVALEGLLTPVDAFQSRYHVPIVVGEWGGIRWLPGIDQYIVDQLSLFEARGWSWLWYAWDDEAWFEQGFGLHYGPDPANLAYDPQAPAFRPILVAWQKEMQEDEEGDGRAQPTRLVDVARWLYILDVDLEPEMLARIADSQYGMVVFDFIPSQVNHTDYPMAEAVAQLHSAAHPKLVIAYINIGQAEAYRTYWRPGWGIGRPEWIVGADPDGWEDNFPAAYWYEGWRDIWLGQGGYLQAILDAGFDGVYLDWVEAYSDENVAAVAEREGVDPRQEMIWWVGDIADFARAQRPGFIVIAQNAAELAEDGDYLDIVDAIAQEQVWFDGGADNDPPGDCPLPRAEAEVDTEAYQQTLSPPCRRQYEEYPEGTLHVSSQEYLRTLTLAHEMGEIILTVDYSLDPANIAWIYTTSRALGFVPFVSSRVLDRYVEPVP